MTDYNPPWYYVFPEPERGEAQHRPTGPRREPPALCPCCGDEVLHPSQFGDPTCGESACREAYLTRPRGTAR